MNNKTNEIFRHIPAINRGMRIYYDRGLQQYRIGWAQQFLLQYISKHPGTTSQEVAEEFRIEKGTASKNIKKLYDGKYVSMESDTADRRSKRLYATALAEEVIREIVILQERLQRLLTEGLEEREMPLLEKNLELIYQNLSRELSGIKEGKADDCNNC